MVTHKPQLLLACDLDRTILPNGTQSLSENASELFSQFVRQEHVTLAYISGRDLGLIREAIKNYHIPIPDIAVGDVGTTVYIRKGDGFTQDKGWTKAIAPDWNGYDNEGIGLLLEKIKAIIPQEPENQNTYKRSYYTSVDIDKTLLIQEVQNILRAKNIKAASIFSIDEQAQKGLLDILSASATKAHALKYLQKHLGLEHDQVIYAGDSGNDIDPLTSGYKAILVNNAREAIKEEVKKIGDEKGILSQIYFAKGGYKEMNGNYTAGILEGLKHFKEC